MQTYEPYRKSLLTTEQLTQLNRLRPWMPVWHTLLDWSIIVASWVVVALWTTWWSAAVAVVFIGARFYALMIIAHDGLHRRTFNSIALNDLWIDLMILGSIGTITRLNRHNHMKHHVHASLANDPDRFKYAHAGKETTFRYFLFLTGVTSVLKSVRNVLTRERTAAGNAGQPGSAEGYRARDIAILVSWQLVLMGGLSFYIGWWAYPVLWILPVYLFGFRGDLVRVFAEHSMLMPDPDADRTMRLITYRSNWFEKLFFAPHNMNFHMAHHLWPSIPYYNLPEADRLIRESPNAGSSLVWRDSYLAYLIAYWRYRCGLDTASVHTVV